FYRAFSGADLLEAVLETGTSCDQIILKIRNSSPIARNFTISSAYTTSDIRKVTLFSQQEAQITWDISISDNWYDLVVTETSTRLSPTNKAMLHFAGHIQTGRPSRTDPLMGRYSV
ncbi:MAG: phospholipase domain-containing protein, partial [Gluconobacter oxydans]|uniref:phospholipase domain-containing protein n=2 Tax=Acetobacteraceae TaxID=433 RepID=UPI0039ED5DAC